MEAWMVVMVVAIWVAMGVVWIWEATAVDTEEGDNCIAQK